MDLVTGLERVEVLGLVKVPQHGGTVLTTGSAKGSIGRDGDGVDVASVADVVGLETARSELPNLEVHVSSMDSVTSLLQIEPSKIYILSIRAYGDCLSHGPFRGSEVANT